MRRYEAVIFDWHDTLLQFHRSVWEQDKYVARQFFGIELEDEDIAKQWGKPAWELYPALFKTDMPLGGIISIMRETKPLFPRQLMPDAIPLLTHLQDEGIRAGVVTGGTRDFTQSDIEGSGFPMGLVDFFYCTEDTGGRRRSDPRVLEMPLRYMDSIGVPRCQILGVGDHTNDFSSLNGAGIEFAGVTTGLTSAIEFAAIGVHRTVSCLEDLRPIISTPLNSVIE